MAEIDVVRTYLEMTSPSQLVAAPLDRRARVEHAAACTISFFRYLYREVGRQYHWRDRLVWTDEQCRGRLDTPGVSLWVLYSEGTPAGYFELERCGDGSVEIVYFGLMPEFVGRGLGKQNAQRRGGARVGHGREARLAAHLHARQSGGAAELSQARIRRLQDGNVHPCPRTRPCRSRPRRRRRSAQRRPRRRRRLCGRACRRDRASSRVRAVPRAATAAPIRARSRDRSTAARAPPAILPAYSRAPRHAVRASRRIAAVGRARAAPTRAACAPPSPATADAPPRRAAPPAGSSTSYSMSTSRSRTATSARQRHPARAIALVHPATRDRA